MFRLTKTEDVTIESGINAEIIQYNNRQNAVKASDFRSNDAIQRWLEEQLAADPWKWPGVPRRKYVRKRGDEKVPGAGKKLKLEDFAKIRYAWLHEPRPVIDETSTLFQDADARGRYAVAFGVDGELRNKWPREVLDEAMLAAWFYDRKERKLKDEVTVRKDASANSNAGEGSNSFEWLMLYRWHFLALAGMWCREFENDVQGTLASKKMTKHVFDEFMPVAFNVMSNAERARAGEVEQGNQSLTMRNWRRSSTEWNTVSRDMKRAMEDHRTLMRLRG